MLKQLYSTLIYPYILNYGLASLGATYKTGLNKICTKHNKCIQSTFFAHGREHVNPYYNLLGNLKFEDISKLKISLFAYSLLYFTLLYFTFLETHRTGMNFPNKCRLPKKKKNNSNNNNNNDDDD